MASALLSLQSWQFFSVDERLVIRLNIYINWTYSFSILLCVEEWNEFAVDSEEDSTEELYKQLLLEKYRIYYTPYA